MRLKYITILGVFIILCLTFYRNNNVFHKEGKHYGISVDEIQANYKNKKIQRRLNGYAKPDKPDKYVEYFNNIKRREGEISYSTNYKQIALKSAIRRKQLLKSTTENLEWKQLGPANVGGRTRAIIIDPEDATGSTWFAGAVAGGVWKTIDKGESWEIISPNLPNLAISSMVMTSSNPSIIYAGTGEGFFNVDAVRGDGIFKSIDKGQTWQQLESTADNTEFNYVNSIVVNNIDENQVICATNTGIYKSTDGGISWLKVSYIDGRYQKLIQHPTNNDVFWAACHNNGVFKSDDSGETWYQTENFGGSAERIELAISSSNPDMLFALTEGSEVYFSDDGGLNWAQAIDDDKTDFLSGQGWYNNVIASNPNDAMSGFIGGVDLFSFTIGEEISSGSSSGLNNRKLTAERISKWSLPVEDEQYSHADHHNISIINKLGTDFELVVGNDGGLSLSEDGGTNWKTTVKGYITSQFYGIDRHPSKYLYFGGMQDNGSYISPENPEKDSEWNATLSGDGFDVAWHSRKPDHIIGSYYYNILEKTRDGGEHFQSLQNIVPDVGSGDKAPFITCLASSDVDPDLLFVGGVSGISRSDDFGSSWSVVSKGNYWGYSNGYAPKIAISEANPEVVWAGVKLSSNSRLQLSTDGGRNFKELANPVNNYVISNIVTHPLDQNTAYILFSHADLPKILRTTDLGETWEDITGFALVGSATSNNGFPNVATLSMLVVPEKPNELWVGTEIGLFISTDNGITWEYSDNGLPAVSIWDMKCKGDEIVLATHGLGVWTVKREGVTNTLKHPYIIELTSNAQNKLIISSIADVTYDSLQIFIEDDKVKTEYEIPSGDRLDYFDLGALRDLKVNLIGYIGEVAYISNSKYINLIDVEEPVNSYVNNFSHKFEDFYGEGFGITRGVLENNAIQTNHPYEKDVNLTYQLRYPIIVTDDEEMAFIKYEDIAFIEEGEVGSEFPDQSFYDYVIVEATLDGVDWIPLVDGYDYSHNPDWRNSGRNINSSPKQEDYTKHYIELLDYFEPNDTILMRFRLFSDEDVTGWGWAIDNLKIQDSTFVRTDDVDFEILIRPNPINNGILNIDIEDAYKGDLYLKVYNLGGRTIYSEVVNKDLGSFKITRSIDFPTDGVYIVNLMMDDRNVSRKILVR